MKSIVPNILYAGIALSWIVCTCQFSIGEESDSTVSKLVPGDPIDFEPIALFPDRWKKSGIPMKMTPWQGKEVVFLTKDSEYDPKVMAGLVTKLDEGWLHYAKLVGKKPRLYKNLGGKPTLTAVPDFSLTCGYGCGSVGATGIELGAFYRSDYNTIRNNPSAIPDYYFYEMGRNYFTFGDRHSLYTTGFAVFMRYVCVDHLKLKTDEGLRRTIEQAESLYSKSDMPFLRAFTTLDGLSEKRNRLKDSNGNEIGPTDQPVMYASAMLRLRREYGGDEWVERFFTYLHQCPSVRVDPKSPDAKQSGLKQSYNWFVAASCAAGEDLSPVFADEWKMTLSKDQRERLRRVDWKSSDLKAVAALEVFATP